MSEYCIKCDTILSITRSLHNINIKQKIETDTPDTISDTDSVNSKEGQNDDDKEDIIEEKNTDKFYQKILQKIENDKDLTNEEIDNIDIDKLTKAPYYKKIDKKAVIKNKIIEMKEDLDNNDTNTDAYLYCSNCFYNRPIDNQYFVFAKNPKENVDVYDKIEEDVYRNKAFLRTLPRTKNFKCNNKNCIGIKNKLQAEGIFFRKNMHGYETIMVCAHCHSIKYI
jgi:hypothetical protein